MRKDRLRNKYSQLNNAPETFLDNLVAWLNGSSTEKEITKIEGWKEAERQAAFTDGTLEDSLKKERMEIVAKVVNINTQINSAFKEPLKLRAAGRFDVSNVWQIGSARRAGLGGLYDIRKKTLNPAFEKCNSREAVETLRVAATEALTTKVKSSLQANNINQGSLGFLGRIKRSFGGETLAKQAAASAAAMKSVSKGNFSLTERGKGFGTKIDAAQARYDKLSSKAKAKFDAAAYKVSAATVKYEALKQEAKIVKGQVKDLTKAEKQLRQAENITNGKTFTARRVTIFGKSIPVFPKFSAGGPMAALTKKLGFTGMADKRLAKLEAAYGKTAQKLKDSGLTATVGDISKARGEVRSNLVEAKERDAQLNKSHYKGKSGEMSAAKERLNRAQIYFKEDLRGAEDMQKDSNSAQLDVVREQNKAVAAAKKFDHNTQIVKRLEAKGKDGALNPSDKKALAEANRRVAKYDKVEEPKEKPKAPPLPTAPKPSVSPKGLDVKNQNIQAHLQKDGKNVPDTSNDEEIARIAARKEMAELQKNKNPVGDLEVAQKLPAQFDAGQSVTSGPLPTPPKKVDMMEEVSGRMVLSPNLASALEELKGNPPFGETKGVLAEDIKHVDSDSAANIPSDSTQQEKWQGKGV